VAHDVVVFKPDRGILVPSKLLLVLGAVGLR
jgi:hypothetical protein